jgi:hypothetical protein
MNNLTKTLFAGAALCALTAVPAAAEGAGPFHFTAHYGGRVVNKTKMPNHGATHVTSTFSVFTYEPASLPLGTKLSYQLNICPDPKKIKLTPKKTKFGKTSVEVQTYSGCASIMANYTLVKQPSSGDTDSFRLSMSSKFKQNGTKYKGTLNIDSNLVFE